MDRLTKWIDERWAENHDNDTLKWKNGNRACMTKLAQYENTGLTPAEVAELAQAKEDGSIVVSPCKVGDIVKVDVRSWGNVYGFKTTEFGTYLIGEIVSITTTKKQTLIKIQAQHNVAWKRERKRYPISAIGKTVFLAKAEAQAALDRMEGQE